MTLRKLTNDKVLDTSPKMTTRIANKLHKFQTEERRIVLILLNFLKIIKHTDTLIGQTKTKLQETLELKLEFELKKQMEIFSFSPINHYEEGKWLLVVTSFEATVLNITDENNSQLLYQVIGFQGEVRKLTNYKIITEETKKMTSNYM